MKAVIPAAGLGTRFLRYTESQPKEMLPVVDKPAIQYVVEEAVAAAIRDRLIVTGQSKRANEDHFDVQKELELRLRGRGLKDELNIVRSHGALARMLDLRQGEALELGHAVLAADRYIRKEDFAVLLGDDICVSDDPCIGGLKNLVERLVASAVAVSRVPSKGSSVWDDSRRRTRPGHLHVSAIKEKPTPREVRNSMLGFSRATGLTTVTR